MPNVIIAPDARDELRDIWETIAQDDPVKADEVVHVFRGERDLDAFFATGEFPSL